jgi:hypothetical protein
VRTGESQDVAQKVYQEQARLDVGRVFRAVDGHVDTHSQENLPQELDTQMML